MHHPFTPEELAFLKSVLLEAQFAAGKVPPGPWKSTIKNDEQQIATLRAKVDRLAATPPLHRHSA